MVTFTQIFVVVPSLSSYRKPVGFLNAFVMWSVDSNGKEFPWNLTCSQNQEGRWERTERSQLLRIRRFPTSGRPNKHSAFDVNINEVFPVEWIGWLHIWQSSCGLLLTLPDPKFTFLVLAVGKKKKWERQECEEGYRAQCSAFSWPTSSRGW